MSKYTQEQQTAIVEDAMLLTSAIETEEWELERLELEDYEAPPSPPVRQVLPPVQKVSPSYPPAPRADYGFIDHCKAWLKRDILAWVLLICLSLIFIIKAFLDYSNELSKLNKELAQDPDYVKACEEAEAKAEEKNIQLEEQHRSHQEELDTRYAEQLDEYNTVVLPRYERERELWQLNHDRKIEIITEDLEINRATLQELYDTTRILSANYRQLYILNWLYTEMSTSDHDIERATDLLDRNRQLAATESVRASVESMASDMRSGFAAVYGAIEEGNDIQLETLGVLEKTQKLVKKTRRDMNISGAVAASQRHRTNQILAGDD